MKSLNNYFKPVEHFYEQIHKAWRVIVLCLIILSVYGCSDAGRPFTVNSSSMLPTYKSTDIILTRPYKYKEQSIRRYDVVVFYPPYAETKKFYENLNQKTLFLFRVIGLPGETMEIRSNTIVINGVPLPTNALPVLSSGEMLLPRTNGIITKCVLGEGEVFLLGDNFFNALDSRFWGPLPITNIIAIAPPHK